MGILRSKSPFLGGAYVGAQIDCVRSTNPIFAPMI
jgi:hypothetical protein